MKSIRCTVSKTMNNQTMKHKGSQPCDKLSVLMSVPLYRVKSCKVPGTWLVLKHTGLVTVRLMGQVWVTALRLILDTLWSLTSLGLHLEVGPDAVVLRHSTAVVDHAALVRALVCWFDAGETEFVGDVTTGHFHHLMSRKDEVFLFMFSLVKCQKSIYQEMEMSVTRVWFLTCP